LSSAGRPISGSVARPIFAGPMSGYGCAVAPAGTALRILIATALTLGVLVVAVVPLHAELRADPDVLADDDYLRPACRTPFEVFPEPVCPRVVAGESPATVLLALVVVPILALRGRRRAFLAIAVLTASWAAVQLAGPFLFTFRSTSGERTPPFESDAGCGLVNCGLDHTLFHLAQLPFLLAIALIGYRLYRSYAVRVEASKH
jgi:hypothetical protein